MSSDADRQAALLRVAIGQTGPLVPDAQTWEQWAWTARVERVAPLLYHLVDTTPTDLTHEQRSDARQLQGSVMLRCVELEHHFLHASQLLAEHGIRSVILKGGATAHLDYPDPSWREVSDIDLLIDPTNRAAAMSLLAASGWHQGYALPAGHEEFTHAVTLVQGQKELDLHQRIAHRALGVLVPTPALLEDAIPLVIAGTQVLALHDVDRIIHASIHTTTARGAQRRLSSMADVLVLAERRPHLAAEVLARAEGWCVRPLIEQAIRAAYEIARLPLPAEWRTAMRAPIRHRDRLAELAYLPSMRRPMVEEIAYLRLLGGWLQRWRYVSGYLAVGQEYASQHGRSGVLAQLRYLSRKLRAKLP